MAYTYRSYGCTLASLEQPGICLTRHCIAFVIECLQLATLNDKYDYGDGDDVCCQQVTPAVQVVVCVAS